MKKITIRTTLLSLSTAVILGITGCSSGGSDDPVTQALSQAYNGIGIDGILVGSTVCIDGNPTNNKCDAGEPSAITDDKGQFSIAATTVTGPLLLIGGVDNSTGEAFTGSLKAPAGSSVVTPLTSAIQSLVEGGKSAKDAEANVKAAMGLTGVDVNLTTFDPYNEVSANAQAVLAKQTQLQVLVHSATVTVAGADAGTDVNSTMSSVFDAIVGNFDGATAVVELDAATVSAATKSAADEVYKDNQAARVAAKVVAQTSAENSVRDADGAEKAISTGSAADAQANLDAAIAKANSTAEDALRKAAVDAKAAADANAAALDEIERLQKVQQEKEAEIAAAKKAEEDALAALKVAKDDAALDTANREKYEAYLAAQAAAEKAAKEKAEADLAAAQAQADAAAKEKVIAAQAAQREAEALAAAAQAQAQADAAQARQDAADAAALAAADQAKTLQEAQEAVADAQAAAAQAVAQAEVNANVQIANFFAGQAQADAIATQALADLVITDDLADVNATIAEAAARAAEQAATDSNITIPSDNNITTSVEFKNEAVKQAGIAAAALEDAYKIKADAELASAIQQVLDAKTIRITAIKADIIQIYSDTNTTLQEFDVSEVSDNVDAINLIASTYPTNLELKTALTTANNADTAGKTAYSQARTALSDIGSKIDLAIVAINDVNETAAVNAKDEALAAKASFTTAFTTASEKAQEIATIKGTVESIRDTEIGNEQDRVEAAILLSRNAAQNSLDTAVKAAQDANASAVAAGVSATTAGTVASTNTNAAAYAQAALVAAQTAQTQAQEAGTAANLAVTEMTRVFVTEIASISESKALEAAQLIAEYQDSAVSAKDAANVAKIAAAAALTNAQNVEVPTTSSFAFTDGTIFGDFNINNEVEAYLITFTGAPTGSISVEKSLLGRDGSFTVDTTSSTDLEYKDGSWVVETNGGDYTINADGSITLENGDMIKIVSEIDLTTPSSLNAVVLAQINQAVPGDDVAFRDGAKALVLAVQTVESFQLWWAPKNYETNATYATLLDFMNSNSPVGGVETQDDYIGVYFQKNDTNSSVVDSEGSDVTALANALSGKLVKFTPDEVVVGTWGVTDLPNGDLILALTATDLDSFGGSEFDNLVAVADGSVMIGEMKAATTSFVVEEDRVHFNQTAFEDIKGAIETYAQSASSLATLLGGQTLWSLIYEDDGSTIPNTLESHTFSDDLTQVFWKEVVYGDNNETCEGNLGVTFETNSTVTLTGIDETCPTYTVQEGTFNVSVEIDASWNYILVRGSKWYFDEDTARADFLGEATPASPSNSDLVNLFVNKTIYLIEEHEVGGDSDANNDGQPYGNSITFGDNTLGDENISAGYSGGNDEYGAYGIQSSTSDVTHHYLIDGNTMVVVEEQNGDNDYERSVLTYLGETDFNGKEFRVQAYNEAGILEGEGVGILYTTENDREDALAALYAASKGTIAVTVDGTTSSFVVRQYVKGYIYGDASYAMHVDGGNFTSMMFRGFVDTNQVSDFNNYISFGLDDAVQEVDLIQGADIVVSPQYVTGGVSYTNYSDNIIMHIETVSDTEIGKKIKGSVSNFSLDDGSGNTITVNVVFEADFLKLVI